MRRIRVGDLCAPDNLLKTGDIIVSDRDLLSVAFRVDADCLLMVTSDVQLTPRILRTLDQINKSRRSASQGDHTVHQVVIASGPHAGMVGYVPSFWLRTVVPA